MHELFNCIYKLSVTEKVINVLKPAPRFIVSKFIDGMPVPEYCIHKVLWTVYIFKSQPHSCGQ